MNFTEQDLEQLQNKEISESQVKNQLLTLISGIPYADLKSAATQDNGLRILSEKERDFFVNLFENKKESLDLLKFTPASGAATRMFKFLFEFLEDYDLQKGTINAYINKKGVPQLRLFFVGLESLPFFKDVRKRIVKKYGDDGQDVNLNRKRFIEIMLDKDEHNFGQKPKGLFPFHSYKRHLATAFEEHLFESALYANNNGVARLHFTISQEHQDKFDTQFKKRKEYIEDKTNTKFEITYSYQSPSTDTIAITKSKKLLRDQDGKLVFRPGGHGALIKNLNEQHADIIFIKNIDNVVVSQYKEEVAFYKKMLAGNLLFLQEKCFSYLTIIDQKKKISETLILEIVHFLQDDLFLKLAPDFEKYSQTYQVEYLRELLDRPIRVCGMVKNEGEPGGGPFWVKSENGRESLQIIESVQINPTNKAQQDIVKNATHFNPVDIVCGVKNYKGEKFDLLQFVDYKAGFIASKSYAGKEIKALEHPGLWNGGMAYWNTIFVEVPLVTFNPVKTVNDLLKPAHQVK